MTPPAATAAGRTAAPQVPRRVSGPARPRAVPAPPPLGLRVAGRMRVLSDAPLLDRLIHGRTWIAIVAAALLGIVFMQVSLLKLNAGIGADVKTAQALERTNAELRSQVSRLQAGGRIHDLAGGLGLVMPAADGFRYITAGRPGDAEHAANAMRPPDPVQQLPEPGTTTAAFPAGTAPAHTAGTTPAQPAGTAPAQAAGTVPGQTAGVAPAQPAGTVPGQTAGVAPAQPAGTTPVQTAGAAPAQTAAPPPPTQAGQP